MTIWGIYQGLGEAFKEKVIMEDANSFSSNLFSSTAQLAKNLVKVPGDSLKSFESELQYIRTVFPELKSRLDRVRTRLNTIGNSIAKCHFEDWVDIKNVRDDYKPRLTEVLDHILECIDENLDKAYGRKTQPQVKVKEKLKSQKKRLEIETDSSKISTLCHKQIFTPERHPFEEEIKNLYNNKDASIKEILELKLVEKSMEDTPFEWIDTCQALTRLGITLEGEKFIAVDLENHSFHSYYGYTCLMQLSTPTKDFVIDVITLRSEIGSVLGPIFSNPAIVKVFHGAQSDIQWLQRDFNIFIVNMFDTFFASKNLQFPSHSLAYLLLKYAKVEADKKYQLADWRMRPLPIEMLRYARMDTHYLLLIFNSLIAELLEKGGEDLVLSTFKRGSMSTLTLYKPDRFDINGWRSIVDKSSVPYSEREISIIKSIYYWRERIAQEKDESPPAVIPSYMILRLAQNSTDPKIVLETSKNSLKVALENVDSLKEAILNRNHQPPQSKTNQEHYDSGGSISPSQPPPPPNQKAIPKEAVKGDYLGQSNLPNQNCKDDDDVVVAVAVISPPPLVKITNQTVKHNHSKVSFANAPTRNSMSNFFGESPHKLEASSDTAEAVRRVVSSMNISKVSEAAIILANSLKDKEQEIDGLIKEGEFCLEEEKAEENLKGDQVSILRTGEKMDTEDALALVTNHHQPANGDKLLPLKEPGKLKRPMEINETVNLEAASKFLLLKGEKNSNRRIDGDDPSSSLYKKKNVSTGQQQPPPIRGYQLSNAPRTGNRSLTFKPNKQ